jgi:Mg2+-importing ATPase
MAGIAGAGPFWAKPAEEIAALARVDLQQGLTPGEARRRSPRRRGRGAESLRWMRTLLRQFSSPIEVMLLIAVAISVAVGDALDGLIIGGIVLVSGVLGFVQDHRAETAVADLLARVRVDVQVLRGGARADVPVAEVVPGDIIVLSAGQVVAGDARLVEADDLLVDEAVLTGESFPVEKDAEAPISATTPLSQRRDCVFQGTHVVSGAGRAVVVGTGSSTEFGRVSSAVRTHGPASDFARGTTKFGLMLFRVMLVVAALILVINWVTGKPAIDSVLFTLSIAVGLTPQMLPAIVTLSLSAGARRLAGARVIVKRLDAIHELGALTVLCTDKTGTLTEGGIRLDRALDLAGADAVRVADLAAVNAGLQTGFRNPLDAAILCSRPLPAGWSRLGEIPYDFTRKRLTVVAERGDERVLVTKGALEQVLDVCTASRSGDEVAPLDRPAVAALFERLSAEGYRVLGLATGPAPAEVTRAAEAGLCLEGVLAFKDPPKPDAAAELAALEDAGVRVKVLTGDNRLAAAALAGQVGLADVQVVTGADLERLGDADLVAVAEHGVVFAEVEPAQKLRLVRALQRGGECVGFLGDGINDAPALHAANAGISVDSAVDVAKDAAAVVLLTKSLAVVRDGVIRGRQTFANTLKYVRVAVSGNFGNMMSMAVASVLLPFLPLLPRQILLLNFLTDLPSMTIATDRVDSEWLRRPGRWDLSGIRRFMIVFGGVSTIFDLLMFVILILGYHAGPAEFRSAWFVESALTALTVIYVMRTGRPITRSRPSALLVTASLSVAVAVVALPFLPVVAPALGMTVIPLPLLGIIAAIVIVYMALNELLKRRFLH